MERGTRSQRTLVLFRQPPAAPPSRFYLTVRPCRARHGRATDSRRPHVPFHPAYLPKSSRQGSTQPHSSENLVRPMQIQIPGQFIPTLLIVRLDGVLRGERLHLARGVTSSLGTRQRLASWSFCLRNASHQRLGRDLLSRPRKFGARRPVAVRGGKVKTNSNLGSSQRLQSTPKQRPSTIYPGLRSTLLVRVRVVAATRGRVGHLAHVRDAAGPQQSQHVTQV